jgi:2-succinyl-5-enolpyruvyl-6-hydroxy-3-cyclohexene-1-carboxylate synthase
MMDLNANPNSHWASILVDELARSGLEAVCLAPGSRSTPLTLAFAAHPTIRIYRHLDERSAGFFALGMALATNKPVALVCTSGTAAANFHPAIIEAYYSHVPLLILTADRPPELRQSGANQTIDQVKMFGDHVRWSVDAPTPQTDPPQVVLRHMRTLAARAYAVADGIVKGPVHINFPFRKPLEPEGSTNGTGPFVTANGWAEARPYTHFIRGIIRPDEAHVQAVAQSMAEHPNGLIICGPDRYSAGFLTAVTSLARRCGYPILADPLSNLRHGSHVKAGPVLGGYHWWLARPGAGRPRPDVVLRFGAVATSGALSAYLSEIAPTYHLHVRADGEWADDLHLTHDYVQADPTLFCEMLAAKLAESQLRPRPAWAEAFVREEARAWDALDDALSESAFFDGAAVSLLLGKLPEDAILFAGNSLPVRHIDAYGRPSARRLTIYGNRGASGIDGNVSTALGLAAATGHQVVALLGDITFYHDMNGLLAVRQHELNNVLFIVINNDGGGIFHRLSIARHDPPFTDLFLTPHGLSFDHAAAMYGLNYRAVQDAADLEEVLAESLSVSARPWLIEVKTDSAADYRQQLEIAAAIAASNRKEVIQSE